MRAQGLLPIFTSKLGVISLKLHRAHRGKRTTKIHLQQR